MTETVSSGNATVDHIFGLYRPKRLLSSPIFGIPDPKNPTRPWRVYYRPATVEREARIEQWMRDPGIGPERVYVNIAIAYALDLNGQRVFNEGIRDDLQEHVEYGALEEIGRAIYYHPKEEYKKKAGEMAAAEALREAGLAPADDLSPSNSPCSPLPTDSENPSTN